MLSRSSSRGATNEQIEGGQCGAHARNNESTNSDLHRAHHLTKTRSATAGESEPFATAL
jgi:hypothetical protein